jgi:hypothetical protein
VQKGQAQRHTASALLCPCRHCGGYIHDRVGVLFTVGELDMKRYIYRSLAGTQYLVREEDEPRFVMMLDTRVYLADEVDAVMEGAEDSFKQYEARIKELEDILRKILELTEDGNPYLIPIRTWKQAEELLKGD